MMGTPKPDIETLIRACRKEELGTIKEIMEESEIDVNAIAKHGCIDGPLIPGDFPLVAAAGNCNLLLIKFLMGKGAHVNSRTGEDNGISNGMTPLQAAVAFRQDIDSSQRKAAVKLLVSNSADPSALNNNGTPMWELCQENQPDVTLLLIELGMSVTQKSRVRGITMLHRWAASSNPAATSIIELIIAKGADVKALNKQGISPLYTAAVGLTGNEYERSKNSPNHRPSDPVLRLLMQREEYSLSEKIDTLELAGAKLLFHNRDDSSISQAFQYWNEALDLRERAQGLIPKVLSNTNSIVHWRAVVWTTRDQLRELQNHSSVDSFKMQAILVTQRIMSRISCGAVLSYLWYIFAYRYCKSLCESDRNAEILDICWLLMEGVRVHDIRQDRFLPHAFDYITEILLKVLNKLKIDRNPVLSSETLRLSLELVTDTDTFRSSCDLSVSVLRSGKYFDQSTMYMSYNIVTLMSELPEMITPEIKSCLGRFIRQNDEPNNNMLLIACNRKPTLSTLSLVHLLLDVGADPNSANQEGNSPLHLIAYWMGDETESPLAYLLLEFGADLDKVNLKKETPLGVWKRKHAGPGDGPFLPPNWTTFNCH